MPRAFDGTSDKVTLGIGNIRTAWTNNDSLTLASIVNLTLGDGDWHNIFGLLTSGDVNVIDLTIDADVDLRCEGTFGSGVGFTDMASGWQFLAVAIPGVGVLQRDPTFYRYTYATDTWSTPITDSATMMEVTGQTAAKVEFGAYQSASDWYQGDQHVNGFWNRALSEAELRLLPFNLMAWYATNPAALWLLNQPVTTIPIRDLTGGGADETALTNTAVATTSVPSFAHGAPIWLPTHPGLTPPQKLRPDADTTTTGWTSTPLWSKIEEEAADGTVITGVAS
jgi:hypothetical protein